MSPGESETVILKKTHGGDKKARDQLLRLIHENACRVAGNRMKKERRGHSLTPEDLAGEVLLKLLGGGKEKEFWLAPRTAATFTAL